MSKRAGSALALPGAASISPEAHVNACNTASRTNLLFDFIVSPSLFAVARFEPSRNYDSQGVKNPQSIFYTR
jgi:hypothetical protein